MPSAFTLLAFVMPGWPSRHLPPSSVDSCARSFSPNPGFISRVCLRSYSSVSHPSSAMTWSSTHGWLSIIGSYPSLESRYPYSTTCLKNLTWDIARDKVMTTTLSKCPFHLSKGRTTLLLFTPRGPSLLSSPAAHSTSSSATIRPLVSTSTMPVLSTDAAHQQGCDHLRCVTLLALISYFILHVF